MSDLNPRQQLFCEEYVKDFNASRAAKAAGYSVKTARAMGSENLTKPNIQAEIKRLLEERQMPAEEVKARLADMARFNISEYIEIDPGPSGQEKRPVINIEKMIADGQGHLIKGIRYTQHGVYIEFSDPMKALELLGKAHNIFSEPEQKPLDVNVHVDGLDQLLERVYGSNSNPKQ